MNEIEKSARDSAEMEHHIKLLGQNGPGSMLTVEGSKLVAFRQRMTKKTAELFDKVIADMRDAGTLRINDPG